MRERNKGDMKNGIATWSSCGPVWMIPVMDDRQTDRQTDRVTDTVTDRITDRVADRPTGIISQPVTMQRIDARSFFVEAAGIVVLVTKVPPPLSRCCRVCSCMC